MQASGKSVAKLGRGARGPVIGHDIVSAAKTRRPAEALTMPQTMPISMNADQYARRSAWFFPRY